MSDKVNYIGSGKKQNDTWIKASINMDKVEEFIQEYKGHKFIKLNINIKDTPDQYGKDVSISVDTWKPDKAQAPAPNTQLEEDDSNLPF